MLLIVVREDCVNVDPVVMVEPVRIYQDLIISTIQNIVIVKSFY